MTLTEYISQSTPVRMPTVYLEQSEYIRGTRYKSVSRASKTQIFIKEFPGIEYCVENEWGFCYTTDSDGNMKNRSVFYLKEPDYLKRFPK